MNKILQFAGFFFLWCLSFQVAAQEDEADILKKPISLQLQEQTIEQALGLISGLAEINFSYDPSIINTEAVVTADYNDVELNQVLNDLLGDQYQFQVLKDQFIITLKKETSSEIDELPDSSFPDILRISGIVSDSQTKETIPYASISILNEPFGTITNRDGQYTLKIPENYQKSSLVFSCMGYAQKLIDLDQLTGKTLNIAMLPIDIRLKEIKVTAIDPIRVLDNMVDHIADNYPVETRLMTSFYREVLLQDKSYINVSEAVINILKSPYDNVFREDRIRFLKGRKSQNVEPFKWVDFKMQGGPYYITKLDVVKTMDSFLDKEYRNFYSYEADYMIDYFDRPTYVILFKPSGKLDFPCYEGRLFIDQETFALVHAEFSLAKSGMKFARKSLIRKKPKGFNVRPLDLNYQVTYKENEGRWNLNTAQTSVRFRVKSRRDNINSVFHSVSDLLVTNHTKSNLRRFLKDETFAPTDIFTEMIIDYDKEFWGNFNIIQPNDDLRKALKKMNSSDETFYEEEPDPDKTLTQFNY